MDCLPIQLALVEVVREFLLCSRSEEIQVTPLHLGVEFKSKKKACHGNQKIFYVRVSCNYEMKLKDLLEEDGCLPIFTKMILAMQCHEQEAHLSVQQSDETNLNFSTQNILWLSQEDNKICVEYRHTSNITKLDTEECNNFVIHFRVVQPEEYMLLEGQQLCRFLYWLKFLNPMIAMSFIMKVAGAVCNTDFSYQTTSSFGNVTLINDPDYLLWHSKSRPAGKVLFCRGNSVTMEYEDTSTSFSTSLCISSMICFLPVWTEHSQHSSFTGNCVVTAYGPEHIPLQLNCAIVEDFHHLINWSRFSFVVNKDKSCLKDCFQWESGMDAKITDRSFLPSSSSNTNSFLLHLCITISSKNGCSSKFNFDLYNKISAEKHLFAWPALKKSVETTFQKFCNQNKCAENPKKVSLLTNTIPLISKALCDIVSLSTETEFRSDIQSITQTDCLENMRSLLTYKLWKLSNCQAPYSSVPQQSSQLEQEDDDVPVIDSWRELPSHSDDFHSNGLPEERQSINTESHQHEYLRTPTEEQPLASAVPVQEESEINQFLHDESFFEDFEVDFPSITNGNESNPLPEALSNNMDFNNEHEETSVIAADNNTTTNQTDSAWFNEVMMDVSDWM